MRDPCLWSGGQKTFVLGRELSARINSLLHAFMTIFAQRFNNCSPKFWMGIRAFRPPGYDLGTGVLFGVKPECCKSWRTIQTQLHRNRAEQLHTYPTTARIHLEIPFIFRNTCAKQLAIRPWCFASGSGSTFKLDQSAKTALHLQLTNTKWLRLWRSLCLNKWHSVAFVTA